MAPGMGLNAFFAFTVVGKLGYTWQQALGAVLISGVVFLILSLTGVRRWLIADIPHSMRSAIAAGIGLPLAIIALKRMFPGRRFALRGFIDADQWVDGVLAA
jgi:adenine/guanine/hypoxanthine permease